MRGVEGGDHKKRVWSYQERPESGKAQEQRLRPLDRNHRTTWAGSAFPHGRGGGGDDIRAAWESRPGTKGSFTHSLGQAPKA